MFAISQFDSLVPRGDMPRVPGTLLNEALPVFAGIMDIPINALMGVAIIGIPLLVVAGLTRRWSLRALMVAVIVALAGAVIWSVAPANDADPVRAALVIAGVAVVSLAVVVWGSLAAWSWLVGALAFLGLGSLRVAAYGVVWQERAAGALTLIGASALILLIAQRAARPRPSP